MERVKIKFRPLSLQLKKYKKRSREEDKWCWKCHWPVEWEWKRAILTLKCVIEKWFNAPVLSYVCVCVCCVCLAASNVLAHAITYRFTAWTSSNTASHCVSSTASSPTATALLRTHIAVSSPIHNAHRPTMSTLQCVIQHVNMLSFMSHALNKSTGILHWWRTKCARSRPPKHRYVRIADRTKKKIQQKLSHDEHGAMRPQR